MTMFVPPPDHFREQAEEALTAWDRAAEDPERTIQLPAAQTTFLYVLACAATSAAGSLATLAASALTLVATDAHTDGRHAEGTHHERRDDRPDE